MKNLFLSVIFAIANCAYAQTMPAIENTTVSITQTDLETAQNYCAVFFAKQNLALKSPLFFKTMKEAKFDSTNKEQLIGAYDTDDRTVYINTFEQLQVAKVEVFGQAITHDWYISYLVHEISHAYIRDNWDSTDLNPPLQEYLAYSIQLGYINPVVRDKLFKDQPVEDTDDRDGILSIHDFNPYRFAMYSYIHFHKQPTNYLISTISHTVK
jgi:hypothetical protein